MTVQTAFAKEYSADFEKFTAGVKTVDELAEYLPTELGWQNTATVVSEGDGKYIHTHNRENYIKIPEKSRKITVGAKMRTAAFSEVKFPLHFCGGTLSGTEEINNGIFGANWPAGLGLIPQNSTPMKDPESILLSAGWGKLLNENDNNVYVYKNEWFYAKISYDYTDATIRVYYSYDGSEYSEVYSEPMSINEGNIIRSVRLEKNMDFDDITVEWETDSIYDIYIKNDASEKIDSVTSEKSFSVYGSVYNFNNTITEDITTAAAVYSADGKQLLEVKTDKAAPQTASDICLGSFTLEKNSADVKIKFLAWASLDEMTPLSEVKTLK